MPRRAMNFATVGHVAADVRRRFLEGNARSSQRLVSPPPPLDRPLAKVRAFEADVAPTEVSSARGADRAAFENRSRNMVRTVSASSGTMTSFLPTLA